METALQITAVSVLAALLGLLLKKGSPELAMLLTLAAVTAAFLCLTGLLEELMDFLEELSAATGVDGELLAPLYKTIGIALVVKMGGSLCRRTSVTAGIVFQRPYHRKSRLLPHAPAAEQLCHIRPFDAMEQLREAEILLAIEMALRQFDAGVFQ